MSSAPRPGWYRDPAGTPGAYRWWNGDTWTEELSDSAQAPAPIFVEAAAVDETATRPGSDEAWETLPGDTDELGDAPRGRKHSTVRRVVAVLVIVALFAASGLGVGLWLWQDASPATQPPTSSGGARKAPSAPSPLLGGQLDERTRTATIASASMVLPDAPYKVRDDPVALDTVFDTAFAAEAVVHADYDGREDWSAMVALALIDRSLVTSEDLPTVGVTAIGRLTGLLYGNHPSVSDVRYSDHAVDQRSGVLVTAKVHYKVAHLASRYDEVTALIVRLDDGTVVAAVASVPDDAEPGIRDQAAESLESLTVN